MSQLVADFVLQRLAEWGVRRVFGYPGDGINGFLGAFDRALEGPAHGPEFIQSRHEEMSAFMACGHAKFSGGATAAACAAEEGRPPGASVGVCIATSGPGAIHLLNGLYDAKLDRQPVVAIVGQQKRLGLGSAYQQEVDLGVLLADVSEYVGTCMEPAQARHIVDRAFKVALERRGVATVIVPEDVQESPAVPSPPRQHGAVFSSVGWSRPRSVPADVLLDRAADVLNAGERVAILAGQGAIGAGDLVAEVAELLGAGVAKALLGKAALPDTLPFVTGSIGLLGTRASYELMEGCDTLLMVGTSFPYAEWLPEEGQARCVQIDIDGGMIGMRYPCEVPLVGDARDTLAALIPRLRRKAERGWRGKVEGWLRDWHAAEDDRAGQAAHPLNPQLVAHALSARLPDGALLAADSGSSTNWWARQLVVREGMLASLSGTLASMGPGVPYLFAAKLAHPDRPAIAFVGDGAMQMNGLAELITVQRYASQFVEPTFVVCVFNNQDLNQVTWEQRAMGGDRRFAGSQAIPDFPYAEFARLIGMEGIRCDAPDGADGIGAAWDRALACGRPCLLEVVTDPEVPPLPPHITMEQAKSMLSAIRQGDEGTREMLAHALRGKLAEVKAGLPGRHG